MNIRGELRVECQCLLMSVGERKSMCVCAHLHVIRGKANRIGKGQWTPWLPRSWSRNLEAGPQPIPFPSVSPQLMAFAVRSAVTHPRPFLLRGLRRGLCLFLTTPETRHRLTPEQPGVLGLVSTHSSTLPDGCWVATASLNKQNQDLQRFLPLEHQSRKALPYLSYIFLYCLSHL